MSAWTQEFYDLPLILSRYILKQSMLSERKQQNKIRHGKESGVFRFRKPTVNLHKTRHLLAFSVVHQPENPRFTKCFRVVPWSGSFPVPQTPENARFLTVTGRLTLGKRLVNQHSLKLSYWKTWCSPQFTSEILHFPLFAGTVNASKCRKTLVFQRSPSG